MRRSLAHVVSLMVLVSLLVFALAPVAVAATGPENLVPVVILLKQRLIPDDVNWILSNAGRIARTYNIINGFAAVLPETVLAIIRSNPRVLSVDPDVQFMAVDLGADQQIRADQVWSAGDTGAGVPVAILDTGISTSHQEFSGRITSCHSEISGTNTCEDQNGHGTHVAGIVGATGITSIAKGVAPSVSYYIDQVLDASGSGSLSGVIAGIDWATMNGAKVISMSLATSPIVTTQPNCDSSIPSMTSAINNAVAAGVSVVAAAGNSGTKGVGAPGCISSTITVAAVDSADTIASFSSRGGPVADHGIAAPGVNIYSTYLSNGYATMSGTSMATPHVAGTIALLLQANSNLTPTQVKNILFSTTCTQSTTPSCPTGSVPNTLYGYGRVDALRAYQTSSQPIPDFSLSASPTTLKIQQGTSGSASITVTSSNGFNSAVSLTVSGCPRGAACTLSPNPVTPPSGGSAASTLSINTGTAAANTYTLTIRATRGSLTHSTTVSLTVTAPPPNFSISASPNKLSLKLRTSGTSKVAIKSLNGFNSAVGLTVTGCPPGVTCKLSSTSATPRKGGSTTITLTITVSASATVNTYQITVTGTSGTLTHSTIITVVITR